MSAISIRLPDEIEQRLSEEARLAGRPRSEVVREAIAEYVARKEKERFMAEIVAEMRQAYADPERQDEARQLAEEGLESAFEALNEAERETGKDPDETWWR